MRVAARYFYWPRLSEGLPGREKRKGKKRKKKKEGKRLARKNGATDFFSPALISRRDEQISRDEQRYDFFLLFFSSFLSDNRCDQDQRRPLSFFYLFLPKLNGFTFTCPDPP